MTKSRTMEHGSPDPSNGLPVTNPPGASVPIPVHDNPFVHPGCAVNDSKGKEQRDDPKRGRTGPAHTAVGDGLQVPGANWCTCTHTHTLAPQRPDVRPLVNGQHGALSAQIYFLGGPMTSQLSGSQAESTPGNVCAATVRPRLPPALFGDKCPGSTGQARPLVLPWL